MSKTLEQLKAEAEVAAKALWDAEEAARQAEREAKAAEERAKTLAKAKETQSIKIQILTQLHKVIVTSFKDAVLEAPTVTDPYRSKEPNVTLAPGQTYPYISVQARYTGDTWHHRFIGWGVAVTFEAYGKSRVYPELKSGGYSYDKIVKKIKEHIEIKNAVAKREADERSRKLNKTEISISLKKELGLKEDSPIIQGVLEQGYRDYKGRWVPRTYEADDGNVWVNIGSRQCTPDQAKIIINALRMAGLDTK